MNTQVLVAYLAVGAVAKLITLKYPSPGQQWAAVFEVVCGSVAAGLLADMLLPGTDGWKAITFAGIPFLFGAIGRWLAPVIDRARLWWMDKKDADAKAPPGASGPDVERVDRLGAGPGEADSI